MTDIENFIAETQIKLDTNGLEIEEEKQLVNGYQFHITGGAIINIYQNKKGRRSVVVGGKPNEAIKNLFK